MPQMMRARRAWTFPLGCLSSRCWTLRQTRPSTIGSWFTGNALHDTIQDVRFFRYAAEGKRGEPRTGRRIHLDIMPTDRSRDDEVERLKGIGATEYEDHRKPDGTGWVTMADPEGNLFRVERSAAERV